jgi:hypothetical protein
MVAGLALDTEKGGVLVMPFSVDFTKDPPKAVTKLPGHLKVSCQKADSCNSSSKRKRGFVCGSDFSHDDRMQSCAEYCRLCRGVGYGERGGRPL